MDIQYSSITVDIPDKSDYPALVSVWEASVRATHHFLTESDIQFFKPLILNEYLDAVDLYCVRIKDEVKGFLGTSADKIEMLFVDPAYRGQSIGKQLLLYAIHQLKKELVDVNEQNEQAVGFYQHLGFIVMDRSEKDSLGKPYPILHMKLLK